VRRAARALVAASLAVMAAAGGSTAADVEKTSISYAAPTTDLTVRATFGVPAARARGHAAEFLLAQLRWSGPANAVAPDRVMASSAA